MKKIALIICTFFVPLYLFAGITTYTFTSKTWASEIGSTVCDRTSDGWICDKEASEYSSGYINAEGLPYSKGVSVKTGTTGAGATSVLEFEQVRRVTFNFCQNSSKGQGYIYVQVGNNEAQSIKINKPVVSGSGVNMRDSVIIFTTPQTGKVKFWVTCTENAININTISIRSANGGSSVFTMDTYQLVTDITQLEDSDQVIFGVNKDGVNKIMGYFDEGESKNNIKAIKGRYSVDRNQVEPDESAIYTLRIADLNGATAYIFQDEIRYEEAYLVASGGQTKNRLAVWDDVVSDAYGNYGYWTISIEDGGKAVVTNLGSSKSKIIQYNSTDDIFACYTGSQTEICLYRRVEAIGDVSAIVAPLVNFGMAKETIGSRTIEVNANKLNQEITASLKDGSKFSISSTFLDRDGDILTISYNISEAGHFTDTLILTSGTVETSVPIIINRINPITISQAVTQEDYTTILLNDVVVTKKYDKYVYVRDATGSMLIFNRGTEGQDVEKGHTLSNVIGRYINYFGVPEVSPSEDFSFNKYQTVEVLPENAPNIIDSVDVCRYLVLENAVITGNTSLTYNGQTYIIDNKFNVSLIKNVPRRTEVIVSYDYDVLTLYIIKQEQVTGIDAQKQQEQNAHLIMRDGIVVVETESGLYTLQGEKIL